MQKKYEPTCAVGYVGDGVDGSVDGGVLLVDDEAEHGEERGVDESDPEADEADGDHQREEVGREGDEETGDSF